MLNIISIIGNRSLSPGPTKVLLNSMKGLDLIGYPYLVNAHWDATERLWIQTGRDALSILGRTGARVVIGPNTAVIPSDLANRRLEGSLYLLAGPWIVELWKREGFDRCPVVQWPVGIDTEEFRPPSGGRGDSVMVYHKRRSLEELATIEETLSEIGVRHFTVPYGMYGEEEFRELMARARMVVWHGCSETQGIAMQEAMASGLPLLVCDATSFARSRHPRLPYPERLDGFPVTSAPYFSPACGMKIEDLDDFRPAMEEMLDRLERFSPRAYVLENLDLAGQAEKLVHLWDHWGMSVEEGRRERRLTRRSYRTPLDVWLLRRLRNLRHWWGGGISE